MGPGTLRPLAQAGRSVGGELPLCAEAFATLLAVVLLLGEVETEVVLHGQAVGVCGVADVAVVLSDLVKVLVISQATSVTVSLPTFLTGERPPPTFSRVKLLRPRGSSRGVGFLKALVAVLDTHNWTLWGIPSHRLHRLRRARLLEAGTVRPSPDKTFGPVLLMETEVVDELLLDLEGFATFLTFVPAAGMNRSEDTKNNKPVTKEQYCLHGISGIFPPLHKRKTALCISNNYVRS